VSNYLLVAVPTAVALALAAILAAWMKRRKP
jgi:hypothetical protein